MAAPYSNGIFAGTLLDVTGIVVAAVQDRFAQSGMPWRWTENFTLDGNEENTEDKPSPIYVTSAFAEEDDTRNVLPRVVISVDSATPNQLAVGNRAETRSSDRLIHFAAHDVMPVTISCHGVTAGEAAIVGDIVRWQIMATRMIMCERVPFFHDVSLVAISKPTLTKDSAGNTEHYLCSVNFTITCNIRWATVPVAPRLNQITLNLNERLKLEAFKK